MGLGQAGEPAPVDWDLGTELYFCRSCTAGCTGCCVSPSNTNFVKHFITRIQRNSLDGGGGNYCGIDFISGYGNTTSAVNAVDFKYAGGNIDSGIIKMYGLKKS